MVVKARQGTRGRTTLWRVHACACALTRRGQPGYGLAAVGVFEWHGGRLSVPGARSEALRPVMEAARTDVQLPACARGLGRQCGAPFEPKRRRAAGGGGVSRCGRVRSLATAPKLFNIPMLHSQCLQSSRRDGGSSGSRRQDLHEGQLTPAVATAAGNILQ